MAKNQKKSSTKELAGDGGGGLGGFLADEGTFNRRILWRLGSWGVGSIAAITLAILASQTGSGLIKEAGTAGRQQHSAAADLATQSRQLQSLVKASEREIRRLSSAIDTLNSDRDRLFARVTTLEQGIDSVTGSIKHSATQDEPQQVSQTEAAPDSWPVEPPLLPPPDFALRTARLDQPRKPSANDRSAKGNAATGEHSPEPAVAIAETSPEPASASPPPTLATSPLSVSSGPATALPRPKPVSGEGPDETAAIPTATLKPKKVGESLEHTNAGTKDTQIVVASVPPVAQATVTSTPPAHIPVPHTDFGVDLGSANSIKGLRALWRSVLKSEAKELVSLHPIIVLREHSNGIGIQLRLVAGPLSDAAAAAKICAVLAENGRACETAVFEGQRLATNESKASGAVAATTKKPKWTSSRHQHSGPSARADERSPQPRTPQAAPVPPPPFGSSSR
jgi:hypothetical protein